MDFVFASVRQVREVQIFFYSAFTDNVKYFSVERVFNSYFLTFITSMVLVSLLSMIRSYCPCRGRR